MTPCSSASEMSSLHFGICAKSARMRSPSGRGEQHSRSRGHSTARKSFPKGGVSPNARSRAFLRFTNDMRKRNDFSGNSGRKVLPRDEKRPPAAQKYGETAPTLSRQSAREEPFRPLP